MLKRKKQWEKGLKTLQPHLVGSGDDATELAVAQHQLRKATEKATALQVRFANKQARDAAERIFRKPFSG